MGRSLKLAFSVFLIVAGGYFLLVYLQHPTPYGALRQAVPSLFWIGLGAFLLWNDLRPQRKAPP